MNLEERFYTARDQYNLFFRSTNNGFAKSTRSRRKKAGASLIVSVGAGIVAGLDERTADIMKAFPIISTFFQCIDTYNATKKAKYLVPKEHKKDFTYINTPIECGRSATLNELAFMTAYGITVATKDYISKYTSL